MKSRRQQRLCAHIVNAFLNDMDVLEIVGTGGDGSNTFNISTLSSFVASAAGIPVAKHGNRAASSKCGTADCLEALGVKIDIAPAQSAQVLKEINMCFLLHRNTIQPCVLSAVSERNGNPYLIQCVRATRKPGWRNHVSY